jgi:hypothetical protein
MFGSCICLFGNVGVYERKFCHATTTTVTTTTNLITTTMQSLFHRRRSPFPTAIRRTTIFVHSELGDVDDMMYFLFRRPSRLLTSGMAITILTLYTERAPIYTRLGRIMSAEPGYINFECRIEHQHYPLRVPADWVQLNWWEQIRFGRRIRTPETFITPPEETQSEADVPIEPTSHAISRLRPSISMFELNVHAPQESQNGEEDV